MDTHERWQGWRVVAALFIILAVTSGLGFYGLSVYLDAFSEELGLSKGAVGGATAVMFFVSALGGLGVANFIGTHDARHAMVAGGLIGAVALVGLGRVSELWHIYAAAALRGTTMAFDQPARQSLLPSVVPASRVTNAVALFSATQNTMRILGRRRPASRSPRSASMGRSSRSP